MEEVLNVFGVVKGGGLGGGLGGFLFLSGFSRVDTCRLS